MTHIYMDMMEDSLRKKIEVMQKIEKLNLRQMEILEDQQHMDSDGFDDCVRQKGDLIDELTILNDGFDSLFAKVGEEIEGHKEDYKEQIQRMQALIREITDLSNTLEVEERKNKNLADYYFSSLRKEMKSGRQTAAAALNYHNIMNKAENVAPQFFDNQG